MAPRIRRGQVRAMRGAPRLVGDVSPLRRFAARAWCHSLCGIYGIYDLYYDQSKSCIYIYIYTVIVKYKYVYVYIIIIYIYIYIYIMICQYYTDITSIVIVGYTLSNIIYPSFLDMGRYGGFLEDPRVTMDDIINLQYAIEYIDIYIYTYTYIYIYIYIHWTHVQPQN